KGEFMLERITAAGAPEPRGPYSHAVRAGDLIFVSGQLAFNPETGEFESGNIGTQTRRTIENLRLILQAAGADLRDVTRCSVYLADVREFAEMNEVYDEFFGEAKPARTTIQAILPLKGARVEIDCIAYKP
ncbi:MAG TPA: Rid family detoxifying hydrolase, partial [Sphingomonadales bacterium]|nr:Rid family detoxifying hydrolase [Sphingomonadales bacterium]